MNTDNKSEQTAPDKTPYQSPEIVDHGTIEAVTQDGGNGNPDGFGGSFQP